MDDISTRPIGYYLHYTKNKTSNGKHYLCITTQQKYTSLKYRARNSQFSWAVEIMDVIEEVRLNLCCMMPVFLC